MKHCPTSCLNLFCCNLIHNWWLTAFPLFNNHLTQRHKAQALADQPYAFKVCPTSLASRTLNYWSDSFTCSKYCENLPADRPFHPSNTNYNPHLPSSAAYSLVINVPSHYTPCIFYTLWLVSLQGVTLPYHLMW